MMLRACGVSITNASASAVDLGTQFGFVLESPEQFLAQMQRQFPVAEIGGRAGQTFLSALGRESARDLGLSGHIVADDLSQLQTRVDGFKRWLTNGDLQVVSNFDTSRYYLGRLAHAPMVVVGKAFRTSGGLAQRVTVSILCADPHAWAVTATTLAIASNTACDPGTAIARPVITVTGVHTNLLLTLKNAGGTTQETMGFTLTIAGAADTVVIDCDRMTVRKTVSGVTTNAIDTITSGAFPTFLALDPNDGDQLMATVPSLSASFGSGTPTVSANWRKRYR